MKTFWLVGIALAGSVHAAGCQVTVSVHSSYSIGGSMLAQAELKTSAMFREIGVNMRWRNGAGHFNVADDLCGAPIVVQIEKSTGPEAFKNALAYATPYAESGKCIHVFMDRIADSRKEQFTIILLAYVLAHEIAHVLEKVSRHSEEGVLKAHWGPSDYLLMRSKGLLFAPEDVELIHLGIEKRVQRAAE